MGGLKLGKEAQAKFDEAKTHPDKAGYLDKKGGKRKNWNSRWFVMKDNYLFYCKNEKSLPQGIINLHGCTVCKLEGPNMRAYSFSLLAPKSVSIDAKWTNRTYLIAAKNADECQVWVDTLDMSGKKSVERAAQAKAGNAQIANSSSGFGAEPAGHGGEMSDGEGKPTKKGGDDSGSESEEVHPMPIQKVDGPLPIKREDSNVEIRLPRKKEESSEEDSDE